MPTIYLLHFDRPYVGVRRNQDAKRVQVATHYLGVAEDLEIRLDEHLNGTGARLMQVIRDAGITWQLARTWQGGRKGEKRLKRQKNNPRFCPLCNPQASKCFAGTKVKDA